MHGQKLSKTKHRKPLLERELSPDQQIKSNIGDTETNHNHGVETGKRG